MKVLIYGSKGYIGQQFLGLFEGAVAGSADISDLHAVQAELDAVQPDIVINAAGKTGRPNIDWCEQHKEETVRSNVTGPLLLLEACRERELYLVHMSSGCIYQGDNGGSGFSEQDPPNFYGSFYSRSKIWADGVLQEFPVLILRIRMPFDGSDSERSLISKLKKYDRVLDAQNSLTYLPDFFNAAKQLIENRKTGIYNITNPGTVSPYDIMQKYAEIVDADHSFERLTLEDLSDVTAAGRSNCILNTEKLQREGVAMKPVEEALEEALKALL